MVIVCTLGCRLRHLATLRSSLEQIETEEDWSDVLVKVETMSGPKLQEIVDEERLERERQKQQEH